jgi:hypothetical protein
MRSGKRGRVTRISSRGAFDGSQGGAHPEKARWPLLQRAVDRGELGVEGGAQAVDHRNDRERNSRRDETVLDRGCPRFVRQELLDMMLQLRLQMTLPPTALGARTTTGQHLKLSKSATSNFSAKSAELPFKFEWKAGGRGGGKPC